MDIRGDRFPKKWVRPAVSLTGGADRAYVRRAVESSRMAKVSPFRFLQEVRAEMSKVTWPSRRETAITTAMVFVMVAIASVFFLIADWVIRVFVTFVLTTVVGLLQ